MEGVAAADAILIDALLQDNELLPVSVLIAWINGSGLSPSSSSSSLAAAQEQALLRREDPPSGSSIVNTVSDCWTEKLNETTPHSFALSFLNYVRAESDIVWTAQRDDNFSHPLREIDQSKFSSLHQESQQSSNSSVLVRHNAAQKEEADKPRLQSAVKGITSSHTRRSNRLDSLVEGQAPIKSNEDHQTADFSKTNERLYEDNFPALGGPRPTQNIGQSQAKPRRRVNPTPMMNPVVDCAFVLAKVEPYKPTQSQSQSKTKIQTSGPLKVDMDVLMRRFEKTKKQKQKDKDESSTQERSVTIFSKQPKGSSALKPEMLSRSPITAHSASTRNPRDALEDTSASNVSVFNDKRMSSAFSNCSSSDLRTVTACFEVPVQTERLFSGKLKKIAAVHAKLLTSKMVPSFLAELQYLFQLLCMEPICVGSQGRSVQMCGGESHKTSQTTMFKHCLSGSLDWKRLFSDGEDCSFYACAAMELLGHILDSLGEHLLSALIEHPAICRHSPALVLRMKGLLAFHQASALRSFKAYDVVNRQSASLQQLASGSSLQRSRRLDGLGMPVSLPFQAARDSRNNFRTRESQKIYNNRELCRDHFYAILREAALADSTFDVPISGQEVDAHKRIQENTKILMKQLLAENYPWFTDLFLEQVVQVSACGETDPVVTDLVRQDPAKLQRLHDRLTLGSRNRTTGFIHKHGSNVDSANDMHEVSPGSPWSEFKNATNTSKYEWSLNQSKEQVKEVGHGFACFFSPSMRAYVWFLEAADSYRLNTQMMWSLQSKIRKLTELSPRDAADIGSALTERVLSLKALAGLLGFLFFSPGVGALPPVPGPHVQDVSESEWEIQRSDPPLDLVCVLEKAKVQESMLLTLPWVLDFLRLMKSDRHASSLPYFRIALSALRDVYTYSVLDPESDNFGVSSICILAALDSFFEFMDVPIWDINEWHNSRACKQTSKDVTGSDSQAGLISLGLDRMVGVVDTRYIQNCCPSLMDLRSVLVEAYRKRQNQLNKPYSPSLARGKSLRKITAVQHPKQSQMLNMGKPLIIEDTSNGEDYLKVKLQQTFFEQRPQLQRLVDFIVDTAAVNAACAASLKCVPSILEEASKKLEVVLSNSIPDAFHGPYLENGSGNGSRLGLEEAAVEHIISSAIQQALVPALEYARKHAADRTAEALAALAAPNEAPAILGMAAGIAAEASGLAACQKALANISSDIRKRVTQDVEHWRRISQQSLKVASKSELHAKGNRLQSEAIFLGNEGLDAQVTEPLSESNFLAHVQDAVRGKENINMSCNLPLDVGKSLKGIVALRQPKMTEIGSGELCFKPSAVKRQLSFTHYKCEVSIDGVGCVSQYSSLGQQGMVSLADRTVCYCALVNESCQGDVLSNKKRNLLRVHLAAVCTTIEGMLSQLDRGVPAGGFDLLVFKHNVPAENLCLSSDSFNPVSFGSLDLSSVLCPDDGATTSDFRIEKALAHRSVALALRFCLFSPFEAFGYDLDSLRICSCIPTSNSGFIENVALFAHLQPLLVTLQLEKSFTKYATTNMGGSDTQLRCPVNIQLGGPIKGLLFMWTALVKCRICEMDFFVKEFLAPWRWMQAILNEPWKTFDTWFQTVKHGVANLLLQMIVDAPIPEAMEKSVCKFLVKLCNAGCHRTENGCSVGNESMRHVMDSSTFKHEFRKLIVCISMELLWLHAVRRDFVDALHGCEGRIHEKTETCGLCALIPLVEAYCNDIAEGKS